MKKLTKFLSLVLAIAMILSCAPLTGLVAFAENNITALYITDTIGGDAENIDITADVEDTAGHWSWNATDKTLTLDGFNGQAIEANGDLTIILKGENSITLPGDISSSDSAVIGICVSNGSLTITDDDVSGRDSLFIGNNAFTHIASTNMRAIDAYYDVTIEDVDVDISMIADAGVTASDLPGSGYRFMGIMPSNGSAVVKGDATLDINSDGYRNVIGVVRTLEQRSTGAINITIKKPALVTSYSNLYGANGLQSYASGEVNISVDIGASTDDNAAINNAIYVGTDAGTVTLNGYVQISASYFGNSGYYGFASNKEISLVTPGDATGLSLIKQMKGSSTRYYFTVIGGTNDGQIASGIKIANTTNPSGISTLKVYNPISYPNSDLAGLTSLRVDKYFYTEELNGCIFGGVKDNYGRYTVSIDPNYPLPAGLTLSTESSKAIKGTPTTEGSGTVRFLISDSSDPAQTAYIDIPWTVTEPEKYLTVGGSKKLAETDLSGTGWSWDMDTATLILDGYNGNPIAYDGGDLNIILKGANTINLKGNVTSGSENTGISVPNGSLTITDDDVSGRDSLFIGNNAFTHIAYTNSCGIDVYGGVTLEDVDVDISMIADEAVTASDLPGSGYRFMGIMPSNGSAVVKGDATLDINSDGYCNVSGVIRTLEQRSTGAINITVKKPALVSSYSNLYGASGLQSYASGEVNISVDIGASTDDNTAIFSAVYVGSDAGTVTLNGYVRIDSGYFGNSNYYGFASNKDISLVTPGDAEGLALIKQMKGSSTRYYFTVIGGTNDGQIASGIKIANTTNPSGVSTLKAYNPISYPNSDLAQMASLKIGTYYYTEELNGCIFGGVKDYYGRYTISVDPNYPLPAGLTLSTESSKAIKGTPTTEGSGTVRFLISDSSDPAQSTYIDIPWTVSYQNPVTGVSLNKLQTVLNIDETDTLVATVTPDNASVNTVSWKSGNNSIASVSSDGVVTAKQPGSTTITCTTTQGKITAKCNVYVKYPMPTATVVGSEITGLVANAEYKINSTAVTADADGKIELQSAWFGKALNIVRTYKNNPLCNSDAQVIAAIAGKYILSSDVVLLTTEFDYTGSAITPEPVVKYNDATLNVGLDYTLSYNNNTACGENTASVTVTGIGDYAGSVTRYFTINKVVNDIEINTPPTKTQFMEDTDDLDLQGGVLKVYYTDGSYENIDMVTDSVVLPGLVASGFDNSAMVEDQVITLTYAGKTTTYNVDIIRSAPTSIEIVTMPTKISYIESFEDFNPAGGELKINYDGYDPIIVPLTSDMVTGFSNTTVGKKNLTVSYAGKTTTFDVWVIAKKVTSIALNTAPTKLSYLEGINSLDLTGGTIKLNYNNETSQIVDITSAMINPEQFDHLNIGANTIVVTYDGGDYCCYTNFSINIVAKSVESIEVTTLPTKIQYCKDTSVFDPAGGKITVYYNNDTNEVIDLSKAEITNFGNDSIAPNVVVTATYGGKTDEFNVSIVDHTWDTGAVTKDPTCTDTGVYKYTCSECETTKTETIAKIAHSYSSTTKKCSCGKVNPSYTGLLKNSSGAYVYYVKGVASTKTSIVTLSSSSKYYASKKVYLSSGKVLTSYTGLKKDSSGNYWYVVKGIVSTNTGFEKMPSTSTYNKSKTVYLSSGKMLSTYTGLKKDSSGNYCYVVDGVASTKTGLIKMPSNSTYNKSSTVYLKSGKVVTSYTGLKKDSSGKYWYVVKGVVSTKTGVFKMGSASDLNAGKSVYIKNGKFMSSYTGLSILPDASFQYIVKGIFSSSTNGFLKVPSGSDYLAGSTVYLQKGKADSQYTAVVKKSDGTYWFVDAGIVPSSSTLVGVPKTSKYYAGEQVYIKKGKVMTSYTGLVMVGSDYFYVEKGVYTKKTGSVKMPSGSEYYAGKTVKLKSGIKA